jgi:hypothetical protein
MIRTILCRTRPQPDGDWLPLPCEQQLAMPEPDWPDYSVALTEDGKRFLALEPKPRPVVPIRLRQNSPWSRIARAQFREAMREG